MHCADAIKGRVSWRAWVSGNEGGAGRCQRPGKELERHRRTSSASSTRLSAHAYRNSLTLYGAESGESGFHSKRPLQTGDRCG